MKDKVLEDILDVLRVIATPKKFSMCVNFVSVLTTSIGFIMGLALNTAIQETLTLLSVDRQKVSGAWIYAAIVTIIGLVTMTLLFRIKCR